MLIEKLRRGDMARFIILPAIIVCLIVGSRVHAAGGNGKEIAFAFIGGCLQVLPDLDRIEAAARALKWKPIEGDIAIMMAPKAPDAKWKGWLVIRKPAPPYFMAISSGVFRGEDMAICTVSSPYIPVTEVFPHLEKTPGLKRPIADESSAGQRTRFWRIEVDGQPAFMSLLDAEPMGQPGLSLSGMMKAKK